MEKVAIYYRVSTDKQDLASQEFAMEKWLEDNPKKPKTMRIFKDEGFSGKSNARPAYNEMMKLAFSGTFDTIIVYRLDRFSRDANTAIRAILELDQFGVAFVSVTQPVLNLGHDIPFRRTLLAAFAEIAELERDTIVARVKSGLDAARKRGVRLGPPVKLDEDKLKKAVELRSQGLSYHAIALQLELSVGTIHRRLNLPQ